MADVSRCISNGWEAGPSCSHAPCTLRRRYSRAREDGAGGSCRSKLLNLQSATTNRVAYQATSQLDHGHTMKPLDLALLQPAEHIVLHPPSDSLVHSAHSPGYPLQQQQQPQQYQQEHQLQEQLLLIDFIEQLRSAPDINRLAALIRRRALKHGLLQEQARVALACMLKLFKGGCSDARHRAEAHACLALLCNNPTHAAAAAAAAAHTSHPPSGVVSSWPVRDVVTLAQVMVATSWYDSSTWQQVVQCSWQHVDELYPHQASQLVWATARLSKALRAQMQEPHPEWLNALLERVRAGAGSLHAAAIAQALHATATLSHMPAQACMEDLLVRGVQQRLMEWPGGCIACVLWSLGTLKHHPGPLWMSDVLHHIERHTYQFSTGTAVASTLWALAALGHAPPKPWMEHFLWQVQRRLKVCNAHALANIAWALARLRYRPPNNWSAEFLRVAAQHMHALPQLVQARQAGTGPHSRRNRVGSKMAQLSMAAGDADTLSKQSDSSVSSSSRAGRQDALQLQPLDVASDLPGRLESHTHVNGHAVQQPSALQSASNSAGLAGSSADVVGGGLARHKQLHRPHRPASSLRLHVAEPMHNAVAQLVANPVPQACSSQECTTAAGLETARDRRQVQVISDHVLMQLWDEQVAWKGAGAGPRSFTMFLWGIAQLQVLPRAPYVRRMLLAMSPLLHAFKPRDLASTLWSLQRLRYLPEPDMYAQLLTAVHTCLRTFDATSLLVTLTAISHYQRPYQIQPDMLNALCSLLTQHVSTLSASQTAAACTSLARLVSNGCKGALPASVHKSLLMQAHRQLPSMQMQELVNMAWACVQLARATGINEHLITGHALLPYVARYVRRNMGQANHRDLIQLAVALSQANYIPGKDWVAMHEAALRRMVKQGLVSRLELQPLVAAYPSLGGDVERLLNLQARAARTAATTRMVAVQSAAALQQGSFAAHIRSEAGVQQPMEMMPEGDGQVHLRQHAHGTFLAFLAGKPQLNAQEHHLRRQALTVHEHSASEENALSEPPLLLQHSRETDVGGLHMGGTAVPDAGHAQAVTQPHGVEMEQLTWQHSAAGARLKAPQQAADGGSVISTMQHGRAVAARRTAHLSKRQGQRERLQGNILRL